MKKAVGCILKSKRKSDATSQRKAVETYCLKHDIAVTDWIECDGGFGAVAFGGWLNGKRIDAVVVPYSGVVSEDIFEYYAYKAVLKRRHSDLLSAVDGGFSGYGLYEKILDKLVDTQSRIELENEPLKKPHDRIDKAARGAYIGGNAPMGYKVVDGHLEVNPEEVPVVLLIMQRKHEGRSKLSTVDALNQNGYRTRNGKPFVISTVQGIWNNEEFYKGFYRIGKDGEWVKGQHEAILKE